MNCADHFEISAVGTCNSCGKGLCPECIEMFSPPLCGNCALSHNAEVAKSFWFQLAAMAAIFVAAFIFLSGKATPLLDSFIYSLLAAFFLPGWRFLGRYFAPSGNYRYPVARWTNLSMHAFLALILGVVVGPIYLVKAWKELKTSRETKKMLGTK